MHHALCVTRCASHQLQDEPGFYLHPLGWQEQLLGLQSCAIDNVPHLKAPSWKEGEVLNAEYKLWKLMTILGSLRRPGCLKADDVQSCASKRPTRTMRRSVFQPLGQGSSDSQRPQQLLRVALRHGDGRISHQRNTARKRKRHTLQRKMRSPLWMASILYIGALKFVESKTVI